MTAPASSRAKRPPRSPYLTVSLSGKITATTIAVGAPITETLTLDVASSHFKPATLETGTEIQVPLFLNEGDRVKVDTRSGSYISRVSD